MENALIFLNRLNVNPYPNYGIFMFLFSFSFFLRITLFNNLNQLIETTHQKKTQENLNFMKRLNFFAIFLNTQNFLAIFLPI